MLITSMGYRSDIQGLRAVAVLAVIAFHFNPALLPGGFVGVDIFLVISGFLIGKILLSAREKTSYSLIGALSHFYTNRFMRIAPAYFATLILISLVAAVLFLPADFSIYRQGLKKAASFVSNSYFAGVGDYFAPASHEQPLLHTWSLAIEVQFYLLAPFIFLLLPRQFLRWSLPLSVIFFAIYSEHQLQEGMHQATYYSLLSRLPAFLAGGWVAFLSLQEPSRHGRARIEEACARKESIVLIPIGLIALALVIPKPTGHFPGLAGLVPVSATAFFIWLNSKDRLTALLSTRLMVWLGALSYSLYLWHWPVLAIIRYYTGHEILDFKSTLAFVSITLALSTASYYWIETPLRQRRSRKQTIGYACLALATLATASTIKNVNAYFSSGFLPPEYMRYADHATICHKKIVGDCLKGDLASSKEVLVIGDSHAAMLNHFFDYLGKELHFKARIITASSCVTIPGFDYQHIAELLRKPCLAQMDQAARYLDDAKVIFLAAAWSFRLSSDDFRKALTAFLEAQSQAGAQIYILEQVPLQSINPLRAMRFKTLGLEPVMDIDPTYLQANSTLKGLSAGYPGVTTLNFESTGVFSQAPFANGMPIYYDKDHLNEEGSKHYAASVLGAFRKVMDQSD